MSDYILEMNHIAKIYGNGVVANSDVNFNLKKGEIHALVGENGAGKSTLMKILFGMEQPSRGEIVLRGKKTVFSGSKEAIASGIGMVHQHFMLVESFSVAQNIVLGMEPKKGLFINHEEAVRFTREMGEKYNLPVEPEEITKNLPVGLKQKVEILKALARGAEILILDEPTAVLTPQEIDQLFEELEQLKAQGHTIVFISHKIPEIKQICDRITVMRSGRTIDTYLCDEVTEQQISNAIMGCELNTSIERRKKEYGEANIQVANLFYTDKSGVQVLKNISFCVRKGMIFGIAGVQGNGQVELIDILTRRRAVQNGEVRFYGQDISGTDQKGIRGISFGYIPEDRLEQGVAASVSISENMISNNLENQDFQKCGMLDFKKIGEFVDKNIKGYEIRCAGGSQPTGMLSGGNMQKVVVARECEHHPGILIAEQPTRGVDVGAAYIIHKKLVQLCEQGSSVLLVSADLAEILKLSDVLAVMYEGEIVAFFESTEGLNEEKLGLYMLGIERHTPEQSILIFLLQPFSSGRYIGNIAETAIPLIFSGLSMAVLFQAGLFNLGGEGVYFMAGIAGSIAAIWLKLPIFIFPLLCLAVGAGTGILVMLVPGVLRAKFNANEMVTSLMMNNICYGVGCYILNNMMRDPTVSTLVSYKYRSAALLPTIIKGTRVHAGILAAILCAVLVYIFLYKTKWGLQVRATGANSKFAKYSGMSVTKVIILVHVIAGAIAGCGGIVECLGLHKRFEWTALPGYGFDGAMIAMLANNNPLGVIGAAAFVAYLRVGADLVNRFADVPTEMISILQTLIILLISAEKFLHKYKQKWIEKDIYIGEVQNEGVH